MIFLRESRALGPAGSFGHASDPVSDVSCVKVVPGPYWLVRFTFIHWHSANEIANKS